jgi:hypothetical protein
LHVFCTIPSQVAIPHGLDPTTHAGLAPCGAPVTAVHVPTKLATSHAAHCPVQDVSQQWLSTQKPLEHCDAVAHPAPSGKPEPASSAATSMSAARAVVVVIASAAPAHIAPSQMAIRMKDLLPSLGYAFCAARATSQASSLRTRKTGSRGSCAKIRRRAGGTR